MPLATQSIKKEWLPTTKDKPETEREYVLIDTAMTAGTFIGIEKYDTRVEQQAASLASAIKEWNVKDSTTGAIAEISYDNILRLDLDDFLFLQGCIGKAEDASLTGVDNGLKEA